MGNSQNSESVLENFVKYPKYKEEIVKQIWLIYDTDNNNLLDEKEADMFLIDLQNYMIERSNKRFDKIIKSNKSHKDKIERQKDETIKMISGYEIRKSIFSSIDKNQDGIISWDEFTAYMKMQHENWRKNNPK
jgi:Ca2+-binding EF-hand superfamily protein